MRIAFLTLAICVFAGLTPFGAAPAQTGDVVIPNPAAPRPHIEFYPPQRMPTISCYAGDDCKCLGRAFYWWLVHHDPGDPRYRPSAPLEYPCVEPPE